MINQNQLNLHFAKLKYYNFALLIFPFAYYLHKASFQVNDAAIKTVEAQKERCLKLIELSNELWNEYTKKYINTEVEVIIEQYDNIHKCNIGHTSNYLEVTIPGEPLEVGSIVKTIYKKYDTIEIICKNLENV